MAANLGKVVRVDMTSPQPALLDYLKDGRFTYATWVVRIFLRNCLRRYIQHGVFGDAGRSTTQKLVSVGLAELMPDAPELYRPTALLYELLP